jgi:hypothetical protein
MASTSQDSRLELCDPVGPRMRKVCVARASRGRKLPSWVTFHST